MGHSLCDHAMSFKATPQRHSREEWCLGLDGALVGHYYLLV